MIRFALQLLRDERGGPLAEYGLVIALVAIGAMAALVAIGVSANTALNTTQTNLVTSAESYPPINP